MNYYERSAKRGARVLPGLHKNSDYERPAVVALFKGLYLWNRAFDTRSSLVGSHIPSTVYGTRRSFDNPKKMEKFKNENLEKTVFCRNCRRVSI